MLQNCTQCSAGFEITQEDLDFYDKVSPIFSGKKELIPPPTLCPDCRRQRRHTHRNERNLYHRKCDLTGKQIISVYAQEGPAIVYGHHEWWTDVWDPLSYGKIFDFSRPFFDQFKELLHTVPQMSVCVTNAENSEYCHLIGDCKNCYLVFESSHSEDCYYGYWLQKCQDCCDTSFSHECTRCYDIDNCYTCHHLRWSRNCTNCADSAFLLDCIGCKHCLFCTNLRQKEYCILNEQYTKEEFEKKWDECMFGSHQGVSSLKKKFQEFTLTQPHRYMTAVNQEGCTGNYIQDSKHCIECFHAHEAEDCTYGEHVWRSAKDCMDVVTAGRGAELLYETTNTNMGAARDAFCIQCWSSSDVLYSSGCCSCAYCFGCVSLKHARYCIFNTQYTKDEYETLVPKIIDHMRKTGEYGEFFPASISLFGYNETVAHEQSPLTQKDALAHGWKWKEEERLQEKYLGPALQIPDDVRDASDDLTKKILICETTGKPYKIIPQELTFYREMNIPIPRECPDQRHKKRMSLRNPPKLWNRTCAKCSKKIETTYAPERPEIVYCEDCYLSTVY